MYICSQLLPHFPLKHVHVFPDQKGVMKYIPVALIPVWLVVLSLSVNSEVYEHVFSSSFKWLS
jgi:hypothetical protein